MIYTDENILKARKKAAEMAAEAAPMMLGAMLRGGCAVTYAESAPAVLMEMLKLLDDREAEKKAEMLKHEEKNKAVYFVMTPTGISAMIGSYGGRKAIKEMFGVSVSSVNEADAMEGYKMPDAVNISEAKMIMPLVMDGTAVLCADSSETLEKVLKASGAEYQLPEGNADYIAVRYSRGVLRGRSVSRQTLMNMSWMNIFMISSETKKGK